MLKKILIEGMDNIHCVGRVEKALIDIDGVDTLQVSLTSGFAYVTISKSISDDIFRNVVRLAGYEVLSIEDE